MIHVVVDAWGIAELGAIATAGADDAVGPDGGTVLLRLLARVEPAHGNERPAQCDIDRRRHSVVIVFVHGCKIIKKSRNGSNFMDIFLKARSVCGSPSDQRAISSLPSPQMKESSPRLS